MGWAVVAADTETRFRFFDNREKYLLFTTTCSEKREIAKRVGRELPHLTPAPRRCASSRPGRAKGPFWIWCCAGSTTAGPMSPFWW